MSESKAAEYRKLLSSGDVVYTYVIAEECVGLPARLTGPTCLAIGLNMPVPILGLDVDVAGIRGYLRFDGRDHFVAVPWTALAVCRTSDGSLRMVDHAASNRAATYVAKHPPQPALTPPRPPAPGPSEPSTNVIRVDFRARRRA